MDSEKNKKLKINQAALKTKKKKLTSVFLSQSHHLQNIRKCFRLIVVTLVRGGGAVFLSFRHWQQGDGSSLLQHLLQFEDMRRMNAHFDHLLRKESLIHMTIIFSVCLLLLLLWRLLLLLPGEEEGIGEVEGGGHAGHQSVVEAVSDLLHGQLTDQYVAQLRGVHPGGPHATANLTWLAAVEVVLQILQHGFRNTYRENFVNQSKQSTTSNFKKYDF